MSPGRALYREDLQAGVRAWALFVLAMALTLVAAPPEFLVVTVLAWIVNIVRYQSVTVVVDDTHVHVGRRSAPLHAFDPSTLDRASNGWPWRVWNRKWLNANPIWTKDSVRLRGNEGGRTVWLNVGTDHREELVHVLLLGIERSTSPASPTAHDWAPPRATGHPTQPGGGPARTAPVAGWYLDPWNPATQLRWWDGSQWTPNVHPRVGPQQIGPRP